MISKLQIFLIFIKVSSAMNSVWMTVLTPFWLAGSAFLGGSVYCTFLFLIKLSLFIFKRNNKNESNLV